MGVLESMSIEALSNKENTQRRRKQSSHKRRITSIVCSSVIMGALYKPKKVEGRSNDLTHEKITQKS